MNGTKVGQFRKSSRFLASSEAVTTINVVVKVNLAHELIEIGRKIAALVVAVAVGSAADGGYDYGGDYYSYYCY